jgi:protein phosphatase PTC1
MNIPYLLGEKNNNSIYLNNINNNNNNNYQSIDRKETSKETSNYIKLVNNKIRNINKSKNNSKIKILEKKYCFINIKNNNSYEKSSLTNIKNNIEDLCFISYSYNEHPNIPHRKCMEDYHCIKQNLLKSNSNIFSYFGIFDGHSGKEAALFLSKNLHKILSKQLININTIDTSSNSNIKNTNNKIISLIKKSFETADNEIINNGSFNKDVGSTGTIILLYKIKNNNNINGNKDEYSKYLICANVGDSKGYILTKNNFFQITKEHKCNDINEVERIKKSGGIVFSNRVFGTLMLTRSFGDKEMKKYGVISTPDCFCHKISDTFLYIIIASDGIWDAVKEEEIMHMGGDKLSSDDFSKKIVKLAIDKGSRDNISCIVIKLNKDI